MIVIDMLLVFCSFLAVKVIRRLNNFLGSSRFLDLFSLSLRTNLVDLSVSSVEGSEVFLRLKVGLKTQI